ncbi:MAG TPA: phosphodiester glycosidase family protein [Enhygromyxa sp.]|nr:phosphodiester glycosidase family protein [Enhygromyxa sp.]
MPAARSWLVVCDEFAVEHAVPRELFELLFCFRAADPRGGPPPPPEPSFAGDFAELERALIEADPLARVGAALCEDVDAEQAELFARRVAAVDRALAGLGDARGRLLRVGLRQRLAGMLAAPGPRAVRVRALADFHYSQLGRLRAGPSAAGPTLAEHVARLEWREVSPGIEHGRIAGSTRAGPVHVNLLRVDPGQVRLEVHDCRDAVARGLSFADHGVELGATAAVSGGFFLYSEPDIEPPSARFDPVGLLLDEGRVISPPVFRRGALAIDEHGRVTIDRLGLEACTLVIDGEAGPIELDGQQAWNRSHGRIGPGHPSAAIVGDRVLAVGRSLPIPLNGFVVRLPSGPAPTPGARVGYAPILGARAAPLRAAIAGGPMLLEHGRPTLDLQREEFWSSAPPVTFSQDETGDRNLLPRLAVGLDIDDRLLFAAIDGRNFARALGMTLAEVGELLLELGCHTATNLDGGSSKRMVVGGIEVDLASTEIEDGDGPGSRRDVHTGVFLFAEPRS